MPALIRLSILTVLALAATPAAGQVLPDRPSIFSGPAIDDQNLGKVAGRQDTNSTAIAEQQATVSRNSVGNNVQTGDAKIADSAFQNMSGLSILNVNTGNNVAINAAMNVTISIQPNP